MKSTNKPKSKLKTALRLLLLVVCGSILGINIYLANAKSLVGNQLPMPFGYGAAIVLSGSMEPEFSKGDLIIVEEASEFAINDIVVFQDGSSLVVHRIIAIDGETVTTKGDANNVADNPIELSALKGKVLLWIPLVGTVVSFLKTPVGTILILAAAILLIEIPRRREKKQDDDERQKIIDEIIRLKKESLESGGGDTEATPEPKEANDGEE